MGQEEQGRKSCENVTVRSAHNVARYTTTRITCNVIMSGKPRHPTTFDPGSTGHRSSYCTYRGVTLK